jgi:predicted nucleic acid-binding protein
MESHQKWGEQANQVLEKVDTGKDEGYISTLVLLEICWYLEAKRNYLMMKEILEKLTQSRLTILQVNVSDIHNATEIKTKYKSIELNDLINYRIMKREGLKDIYTNDAHIKKLPKIKTHF